MKIQTRKEGDVVPQGISVTVPVLNYRLHFWVRFKVDDTHDRIIHIAVPRDNPTESLDWILEDDTFKVPK